MAINVNEVYKTALLILNKEQRGYVTPNEFNKIATQVQLQMFENYAEELNQQLRVPQADSDYSDRIMNTDEKLSIFKSFGNASYDNTTTPTTPFWTMPTDLYRLGTVVYTGVNNSEVELQRLQRNDFYNIQKSLLTASTKYFPTYLYENERLYVKPNGINSGVSVNYLRKPTDPRWGYSVGTLGQYIYDPTVYGEALLNIGTGTLTSSITTGLTGGDINTYTPTLGLDLSGKEKKDVFWSAAQARYADILSKFPGSPTVWVGDMNVAPLAKDADVKGIRNKLKRTRLRTVLAEELPSCSKAEREQIAQILKKHSLVDAFEHQRDKTRGRESTGRARYTQYNHGNRKEGYG